VPLSRCIIIRKNNSFFYNFLELINQKEMKGITIVACKIFQEETIIPDTGESLPPFLLMALTDFFRQERVDNNKAVILKLFLSKESQILKWLLLEDIIFAVWSEDPSFQSRVINFVVKNYTLRNLVSTLVSHSKAIGKKLPSAILNSLLSKDPDEDTFERKKEILIILKEASSLGDKTVTKVWMEYVKALNRYEIIRLTSCDEGPLLLQNEGPQLSLRFKENESAIRLLQNF
jgi:hypothetical protein